MTAILGLIMNLELASQVLLPLDLSYCYPLYQLPWTSEMMTVCIMSCWHFLVFSFFICSACNRTVATSIYGCSRLLSGQVYTHMNFGGTLCRLVGSYILFYFKINVKMHHLMLHLILVPLTNPIRLCIPQEEAPFWRSALHFYIRKRGLPYVLDKSTGSATVAM